MYMYISRVQNTKNGYTRPKIAKLTTTTWLRMFRVAYLVHVYISGGYILVASIDSFILVIPRAPLAEVLHLLHELLGKGLGDQRVPVDIGARLEGGGARQMRWLLEGIHGVM